MGIKMLAALAAAGGLALAASQAQATTFAGSWNVSYENADPGLVLQVTPINPTFNFSLAPNDPLTPQNEEAKTISLFKIYTDESTLNGDDLVASPIELSFTFTAPTPNSVDPVTGNTQGVYKAYGLIQAGKLTWNNGGSTKLYFGNNLSGLLSIDVNGGEFNEGFLGLDNRPKKALTVKATFDWDHDPIAVPEPSTWALMIGGFGMAGATLRRRRAVAA